MSFTLKKLLSGLALFFGLQNLLNASPLYLLLQSGYSHTMYLGEKQTRFLNKPPSPNAVNNSLVGRMALGYQMNQNHALEIGYSSGTVTENRSVGTEMMKGKDRLIGWRLVGMADDADFRLDYEYETQVKHNYKLDFSYVYTFTEGLDGLFVTAGLGVVSQQVINTYSYKYMIVGDRNGTFTHVNDGEASLDGFYLMGIGYSKNIYPNMDLKLGYVREKIMNYDITVDHFRVGLAYRF